MYHMDATSLIHSWSKCFSHLLHPSGLLLHVLHPSRISFDLLTLEVLPLPFDLVRFYELGPVSASLHTIWQISRVHNIADIEVVCQVSTYSTCWHSYIYSCITSQLCHSIIVFCAAGVITIES